MEEGVNHDRHENESGITGTGVSVMNWSRTKKGTTGVGSIEFLEILCPLCILSIIGSVVRCFFS